MFPFASTDTLLHNLPLPFQVRGIKALEYRPEPNVFNMGYPNNFCYCPGFLDCAEVHGDEYDNTPCRQCLDGMIRVSSCYGGVPVVMTAPHFFRGDNELITAVEGMVPDGELHDTVLYIEPLSGVAMRAHKRIQVGGTVFVDFVIISSFSRYEVFHVEFETIRLKGESSE